MKEQSHKDEMAEALRGDFARLRARGVEALFGAGPGAVGQAEPPPEAPATTKHASRRTGLARLRRRG